MKYETIYNYLFIFTNHKYLSSRKEPGVMYAVNDTLNDVGDEDTFQNKAVTNKSKDKQVLKTYLNK